MASDSVEAIMQRIRALEIKLMVANPEQAKVLREEIGDLRRRMSAMQAFSSSF